MSQTYEQILERMNSKFSELAGFSPDSASDIGIRLKVLAGEIFSAYTNIDWLEKQMFPQTASGEQLELHAIQRGIKRRPAEKAQGKIKFCRYNPAALDLRIPAGTVCSTPGVDGIRFVTTTEDFLPGGETQVYVSAQAEKGGEASNTAANTITVMINPPPGITFVGNDLPFIGGTDGESDESLRDRLIDSYKNASNGTNSAFYHDFVSKYEEIDSVSVIPREQGVGSVSIYVSSKSNSPSEELMEQIREDISGVKEINVDVILAPPEFVRVDVNVQVMVKDGYSFEDVQASCLHALMQYFDALEIGEPYLLAAVGDVLFHTDGVQNYKFKSGALDKYMTASQKAIAGTINITEGSVS